MEKINQHTDQVLRQLRKGKRKRRAVAIAIVVLLLVSAGIIFRNDIKSTVASTASGTAAASATGGEAFANGITILKKWDMPSELAEISGLAYLDGDRFACVQDESGIVFIYNTAKSSIESEIPFGPAGDYEGLAVVGDNLWVVRSDGRLFEVKNRSDKKPVVTEYSTALTAEQNVEGLCYDKANNRLLLAIKDEEPGNPDYKGVYSFDLGTRKMPAEPAFKIDLNDKMLAGQSGSKGKSGKKNKGGIKPSAIAVDPATGDVYITDGPRSRLLVMDANGKIRSLYELNSSEFAQPEGITFKPDGELFISNEGKKQSGNIVSLRIEKKS